ncbi:UPF0158 family protein [Lentibacillus juripiscarius]|uniref:UPF0158 family protein n=1 Tax=Lentibacillus juripiscarius TaxID=257446 RepID=A0ABW5V1S4_9BACI
MGAKVKLTDIIDEMEMQTEEDSPLLKKDTGEIIYIMKDFIRMAEDGEPYDHLPDWQQEQMELAIDFVENEDKYVELPSKFEIDEYAMIEDFCFSVKDSKAQEKLLRIICGKGAFRRFKDEIIDLDLEDDWYTYRDNCYKQIAIDFCERHKVEYTESKGS